MAARASRTQAQVSGHREAAAIAATLGGHVRRARRARRMSQRALAARVGLSGARLSEIERGLGTRASLETWIAIGVALGRPLAVTLSRPLQPTDADDRAAGHLRIQEHVLRLARATDRAGTFELPTRPDDPWRSADLGIRDDRHATRILVECWNTIGDLGAAVRATNRKLAEAAATWPDDRIASVWVVAATAANRAILARYPHVIDAIFTASSRAWVHALDHGAAAPPPDRPGLVWFDSATARLREHRRATIRS
jgi:transcriptional regulator with XRE-family HTH domain